MRLLRRYLPFTTVSGAAWFAVRHRRPIVDWGLWTVRSAPRLLGDERDDVLTEAKVRLRLQGDRRLDGDRIEVQVADGRAVLRGDVGAGHREVVTQLVEGQRGVEVVEDELREPERRRRRKAA